MHPVSLLTAYATLAVFALLLVHTACLAVTDAISPPPAGQTSGPRHFGQACWSAINILSALTVVLVVLGW